jgi:hypothetical protein
MLFSRAVVGLFESMGPQDLHFTNSHERHLRPIPAEALGMRLWRHWFQCEAVLSYGLGTKVDMIM